MKFEFIFKGKCDCTKHNYAMGIQNKDKKPIWIPRSEKCELCGKTIHIISVDKNIIDNNRIINTVKA
jgi:hypothetical protein